MVLGRCFDFTVRETPAVLFLILPKSFGSMVISQTDSEVGPSSGYLHSELNIVNATSHFKVPFRNVMFTSLYRNNIFYSFFSNCKTLFPIATKLINMKYFSINPLQATKLGNN